MRAVKTTIILVCAAGLITAAGGCKSKGPAVCPVSAANYYLNPSKDISRLGRVALVELENRSAIPEASAGISEALYEALQKRGLFGLTYVGIEDPAWSGVLYDKTGTYSLEQLSLMQKSIKCDAILVGTVTQYVPYPRLGIGLKLKLVDLRDGELVWALEQFWDTTDKAVECRIEDFWKSQMRSGYDPLQYRMAMTSPKMFMKFVAYEAAGTLK